LLQQQKGGVGTATPEERLQKALYVFNFLNSSLLDSNPPIVCHFNANASFEATIKAPVLIRDSETGKIMGPYPLITWGEVMLVFPQKEAPDGFQQKACGLSVNRCHNHLRTNRIAPGTNLQSSKLVNLLQRTGTIRTVES